MKKQKEMSSENRRTFTLIGVMVTIFIIIILITIFGKTKSSNIMEDVKKIMDSSDPKAIYIMRDDCTYCQLNKSNMDSIVNEYGFEYYNVDIDDLTSDDLSELLYILDVDTDDFGTPYMVVVKDGRAVDSLNGLRSYAILFDFLKENELISGESNLYLNYPTLDEYNEIIKSTENAVIVLATSYCQYCLAEHPILIEIAKETHAKINYIYLDYLFESEDEYNDFMGSLTWFEENTSWGTPTTLIVKNGEVKTYLSGYREKDEVISFYKDNGIIK